MCVVTNGLTFAQEPEGNELGIAQVDDLYGKRSALVTNGKLGTTGTTHSCANKLDPWRKKRAHTIPSSGVIRRVLSYIRRLGEVRGSRTQGHITCAIKEE